MIKSRLCRPSPLLRLFLLGWILPWISCLSVLGAPRDAAVVAASLPTVYTIAGSDSGGGAGIQADLHAMHAMGCHGCSAITCLTAQNSQGVDAVHTPPASFLRQQLETLNNDMPPRAIKIGMLASKELVMTVADFVRELRQQQDHFWVVLDPVMISTSGHRLIDEEAADAMVEHLFPLVDILTPNKYEAEALLSRSLNSREDVEQAARDLLKLGVPSVLIKGGHTLNGNNNQYAQDYFLSSSSRSEEPRLCDGNPGVWLQSKRYDTSHTHGTGCTLSSALAAALALGQQQRYGDERIGATSSIQPVDAICLAKAYVTAGIAQGVPLGQGPGPVAQTCFPESYQHYPSVVVDPSIDAEPFVSLRAFDNDDNEEPTLGRILPIVDSVDWVERLCRTPGVTDVQLRLKNVDDPERIAQECQRLCQAAGVRLWINDNWQAAVAQKCFGVHLGQEDLAKCVEQGGLEVLRAKKIALGISTHSYGELAVAFGIRPSYISLGPVYATQSKDVKFDPQGLETVTRWRQLIPPDIPLVAIGGIGTAARAQDVRAAGADCVAVIGAVIQAEETQTAVSELNRAMA